LLQLTAFGQIVIIGASSFEFMDWVGALASGLR
jgi:hypothetical protein